MGAPSVLAPDLLQRFVPVHNVLLPIHEGRCSVLQLGSALPGQGALAGPSRQVACRHWHAGAAEQAIRCLLGGPQAVAVGAPVGRVRCLAPLGCWHGQERRSSCPVCLPAIARCHPCCLRFPDLCQPDVACRQPGRPRCCERRLPLRYHLARRAQCNVSTVNIEVRRSWWHYAGLGDEGCSASGSTCSTQLAIPCAEHVSCFGPTPASAAACQNRGV